MEYLGVFIIGFIFGAMFGAFIVLTGNSNEPDTQYTAGGYQPKGTDKDFDLSNAKAPKGGTVQQDK